MTDYSTDELLLIANNVMGEYSEKEVRQAKRELKKRDISDKMIADSEEEDEKAFMKRLDTAARTAQIREDKRNEKNRKISYQWWEMIPILVFAPLYMTSGIRHLVTTLLWLPVCLLSWTPVDFSKDLFPEQKRLKAEKYDLKFKQRILLLIFGDICWLIYGFSQIYK